jgi:hypothetical protein
MALEGFGHLAAAWRACAAALEADSSCKGLGEPWSVGRAGETRRTPRVRVDLASKSKEFQAQVESWRELSGVVA